MLQNTHVRLFKFWKLVSKKKRKKEKKDNNLSELRLKHHLNNSIFNIRLANNFLLRLNDILLRLIKNTGVISHWVTALKNVGNVNNLGFIVVKSFDRPRWQINAPAS